MEYFVYKDEDELTHWGVRGMRWGVRRFQNKDGTLTKAGQKRYNDELAKVRTEEKTLKNRKSVQNKLDKLAARKKAVEDGKKELDGNQGKSSRKAKKNLTPEDANPAKKSIKDMTDDELAKAVNRARLEESYRQLNPEPPVKQSLVKKLVNDVVAPAAVNSGKRFLENALNKMADKALNGKGDGNSLEALKKTYEKLDYQDKILKVQKSIEKRQKGTSDDSDLTWDEKLKKQQWEDNERKRAKEEAKG